MKPRIALGSFLVRLGAFLQTLPVVIMRPGDLTEVSRRMYARPRQVEAWGDQRILDSGLSPDEKTLLKTTPIQKGRLLLLGVGGGREAIYLAKKGFTVTGLDFIPEMVRKARRNAARNGVSIEGVVQEISVLDLPPESWDVVWMSTSMYSCIPTRKRRVEMLKRIRKVLKPGGFLICRFHWDPECISSPKRERVKKLIARLTMGNTAYEKGDLFWNNVEFLHAFSLLEDLQSEIEEGSFETIHTQLPTSGTSGGVVLRKNGR